MLQILIIHIYIYNIVPIYITWATNWFRSQFLSGAISFRVLLLVPRSHRHCRYNTPFSYPAEFSACTHVHRQCVPRRRNTILINETTRLQWEGKHDCEKRNKTAGEYWRQGKRKKTRFASAAAQENNMCVCVCVCFRTRTPPVLICNDCRWRACTASERYVIPKRVLAVLGKIKNNITYNIFCTILYASWYTFDINPRKR